MYKIFCYPPKMYNLSTTINNLSINASVAFNLKFLNRTEFSTYIACGAFDQYEAWAVRNMQSKRTVEGTFLYVSNVSLET